MNHPSESEEIRLNALLDGELDEEERAELLRRMSMEPALRETYWQLAVSRDLVAHAWDGIEPPDREGASRKRIGDGRRTPALAAAAVVLLAVGFLAGRLITTAPGPEGAGLVEVTRAAEDRVVVHVTDSDPRNQRRALDRVDELLAAGKERVELVAQSRGLDLLRSDRSAAAERVHRLLRNHAGLRVYACGNTLSRLEQRGEEVELLEGTRRASSAEDHIVDRLEEGWSYIKA
jgi:intracellular sulfur oxidation DsrE/DsrF family protein